MKRILVVLAMVLALSSGAMAADLINWTGYLTYVAGSGDDATLTGTSIFVRVNAIETAAGSGLWNWSYELTPGAGVKDVSIFSITMAPLQLASVSNLSNTVSWINNQTSTSVQWVAGGSSALGTGAGNLATGTFKYQSTLAPHQLSIGRAQDGGQYNAMVPVPMVPEPLSVMLGAFGLGAVSLFRKLKK